MNKTFTPFLTICLVLLLFSMAGHAQNPNLLIKATSATSSDNSYGENTAVDASGNVYVTGAIIGSVTLGTTTLVSAGGYDIFLAKYNNTGVFQWAKRIGGANTELVNGIAVSGDDVYITGTFSGTLYFDTPATAGNGVTAIGGDIFLAKYNSAGTFQWVKRAGGIVNDEGLSVAVSGNDVYITGTFQGSANFNTPSSTSSNEIISFSGNSQFSKREVFLAKYNSAGDFQWAKRAGGYNDAVANGVAVSDTNVYITGVFEGTAQFNSTEYGTTGNQIYSDGGTDIFLAKYNSSGDFKWARRAGGNTGTESFPLQSDGAYAIAAQGNDVYITGTFKGTVNFNTSDFDLFGEQLTAYDNPEATTTETDIFLAKYNSEGSVQWVKRAGGFHFDAARGIAVSGNDVFITGSFAYDANFNTPSETGSNEITATSMLDMFLAKYNTSGDFLWAKRAGGYNPPGGYYSTGRKVAISSDGVFMTGGFRGTVNFNTPSASGSNELSTIASQAAFFLARYSNTPTPRIIISDTLTAFSGCGGTAGSEQSFIVSGLNLTANIVVTAPTGFEVSTTGGGVFNASVNLPQNGGSVPNTTVYIRMAANAIGTLNGNITCTATGATTQKVAISGTVTPGITLDSIYSVTATATSFRIPYTATIGSPDQYSISTGTPNAMPSFVAVNNAALGTSPISVPIPASAVGTYNFNLSVRNSTTGCVSTVPFELTVRPSDQPFITRWDLTKPEHHSEM